MPLYIYNVCYIHMIHRCPRKDNESLTSLKSTVLDRKSINSGPPPAVTSVYDFLLAN